MANPLNRPLPVRDVPCAECGATVHMISRDAPRRLGESLPRSVQVAKCSNPACETNPAAGTRKLGTPLP